MAKAVKLADIAEKMGVSSVTVSKALSGKKGVSEEMRERIREYAKELGYKQPSVARKEAASRKSYQIGVLIKEGYLDKYESFYWQVYKHLCACALDSGSFAMLEIISSDMETKLIMPEILKEKKIQGLVVIGKMCKEYLERLKRTGDIPSVYLDFSDEEQDVDSVMSDGYYGAYYITNYLISQGHQELAYVGTLSASGPIMDRYLGYVKALLEHGIEPKKEWLLNDRNPETGFIEEDMIKLPDKLPDAFLCNCDLTAGRLIHKLTEKGIRVPEDVSVTGFDNCIYPGICNIEITTYEVDRKAMARQAMDLLLKRLGGKATEPETYVVSGKLVIKNSVKPNKGIRVQPE
ncbi:MAG: LacI family DNA-binding transcriptional regulator [Acetatifactor sp.]